MEENLRLIWEQIAEAIKPHVTSDTFDRWFSSIKLAEANDERITLQVPNNIYQLWIETNYLHIVQSAVLAVIGASPKIGFVIPAAKDNTKSAGASNSNSLPDKSKDNANEMSLTPEISPKASKPKASRKKAAPNAPFSDLNGSADITRSQVAGMNARYTFDSFVVGADNQYAHAASLAVSQAPGRTYNPLFIHGGVGLGKTHLMQAIGHEVLPRTKSSKILYISSETFTNNFINAIQNSSLVKFRRKYRQADVLLIDDIQFLAGKERSQEEFFHTFNTLFDGHKQIVLSSDRPPSEISNLESRLVSRFEWGLTAELLPPDIETRLAILGKKALSMNIKIDKKILEFIAERIRTNVRRLEGALVRVASMVSLGTHELTTETVEYLLKDILQEEARRTISIDKIQKRVAEYYDIRFADMTSKRRPANIAFPRQVAMYLSRELTKSSLTEIGDAFGGRDHGTVLHAHKLITKKVKSEEQVRQAVSLLDSQLQRIN